MMFEHANNMLTSMRELTRTELSQVSGSQSSNNGIQAYDNAVMNHCVTLKYPSPDPVETQGNSQYYSVKRFGYTIYFGKNLFQSL